MSDVTTPRYGTRWGRMTIPIIIGFALIAGMTTATLHSVLGFNATLTIMNPGTGDLDGMSFSSSRIQATDAGFGMAPVKLANGTWKNVLRAGFAGATISGLCLSKTESIGVLGTYTVTLSSPSTTNITASNGVFDLSDLVGDKSDTGINLSGSTQIGLSTADITTVGTSGASGPPYLSDPLGQASGGSSPLEIFNSALYASGSDLGAWSVDGQHHTFGGGWTGIDAASADLHKVAGRLWQVQLTGNITLPNLQITVKPGSNPCATWPTDPPYTNLKSFP